MDLLHQLRSYWSISTLQQSSLFPACPSVYGSNQRGWEQTTVDKSGLQETLWICTNSGNTQIHHTQDTTSSSSFPLVGAREQLFTGHCSHVSTKTSTTAFTETMQYILFGYTYMTHSSLPPSIYRTNYPPLWIGYTCSSVSHCYCLFPSSPKYIESNKEHGIKTKNWAQFLECVHAHTRIIKLILIRVFSFLLNTKS